MAQDRGLVLFEASGEMVDLREHYAALRAALVDLLTQGSWKQIEADHRLVGLAWRPDLEPYWGKPKYVGRALADLSAEALTALGQRCLDVFADRPTMKLQDALWWVEARGVAELSEITRRGIAYGLDGRVMTSEESPGAFLSRFSTPSNSWPTSTFEYRQDRILYEVLSDPFAFFGGRSVPNPQLTPCAHLQLLQEHGFLSWPDRRVFLFLEQLVHPTIRRGEEQREWVTFINDLIRVDGFFLSETGRISKQPVYTVCRQTTVARRKPKNLIFASTGPKPELGFEDAIDNDIVILRHAEHCLLYEETLTEEGLSWEALVTWWAAPQRDPKDRAVRKELGKRLRDAIGSPAEKALFDEYFKQFAQQLGPTLPALLPQVYLHYDPITVPQLRARGESKRFPVQRMDFLLLLRDYVRVVVEVDGMQHYATSDGDAWHPNPSTYAETAKGDRELRLAGYEVYRIGGFELSDQVRAAATVHEFFTALFRRHPPMSSRPLS